MITPTLENTPKGKLIDSHLKQALVLLSSELKRKRTNAGVQALNRLAEAIMWNEQDRIAKGEIFETAKKVMAESLTDLPK